MPDKEWKRYQWLHARACRWEDKGMAWHIVQAVRRRSWKVYDAWKDRVLKGTPDIMDVVRAID